MNTFGLGFENTIVTIEINALEFALLQSLVQKYKFLNLGPKMVYLRIFGLVFENTIVIIEINALKFVLMKSLLQK